ncbi:acyltransferase (plasmid) [Arsenophonus sp. aPb]|uniref:acyltransferase family protein n=1 Tax=Arsenophonus sp. aPb TaxID=3041619 RepID=UPI00246957F2|nr:acyltransferase [Arsenophonus sp. aPb]WGL99916.1 acyltransferase [Arsenophonus sp. aPb]
MFFKNIQALRGIAALIVFFSHLLCTKNELSSPWIFRTVSIICPAGVDIFFVLSGFIVTLSAINSSSNFMDIKSSLMFFLRRVMRIYPAYLIILFLTFFISPPVWLSPDWLPHYPVYRLATLTTSINYKVMVAWTLAFEMFFYLVLSIIIFFGKKKFSVILFSWVFIEIILISYFNSVDKSYAEWVPLNPQIIQFCTGSLMALFIKSITYQYGRTILFSGFFIFIIMCYVNMNLGSWNAWNRTLTLTLPSAMIVYGAIATDLGKSFSFGKQFIWLGNISFSMYLWHQLTFQTMLYLFEKYNLMGINNIVILTVWASIAILIGFLSFNLIEKQVNNLMKNKVKIISSLKIA